MLPMTTLLLLLLRPLPPPLGLASSALEEEEAPPGLGLLPLEEEEADQGAGAFLMGPAQVPPPAPRLLLLPFPRESRSPPPAPPSPPLLLPGRGGAPPLRRCVRVQESCTGHRLPCCDPCAACYCRLFKSNCFCRRFGARAGAEGAAGGASFPCGRN